LDLARDEIPDRPVDKVYHLAARTFVPDSWKQPADYCRTNVQGTANVLDFCRRVRASLIYVSAYCYGIPDRLPIHESAPLRPNNPYAFTKAAAESACMFFSSNFGIPLSIVRPFNLYGPGQDRRFLIPQLVHDVLDPAVSELVVEDLRPRRDFIHADDLVAALCAVPVTDQASVYNVGSGTSVSVEEIVELVQRAAGTRKSIRARGNHRPNEILDTVADISAIRTVGWRPRIGLLDGLLGLVAEQRKTAPSAAENPFSDDRHRP
jgi:nucleoside-diphosphate-sugar epimerase